MVGAYNNARDGADYVALLERFVAGAPEVRNPNRQYLDRDAAYTKSLYDKYIDKIPTKYREGGGEFKDKITKDDIKHDDPYEIDGETRTGGFEIHSSKKLDVVVVGQIRPSLDLHCCLRLPRDRTLAPPARGPVVRRRAPGRPRLGAAPGCAWGCLV